MATNTPNLVMGYIEEGQVRGEITYNEALNLLDALVQIYVSGIQASPPAPPANGVRYIVASSGASGAWAGKENNVACYYDGWVFVPPRKGFYAWVTDGGLNGMYVYNGTSWATAGAIADLSGGIANPPTQAEVTAIYDKVNALLAGLRILGIVRS